MLSVKGSISLGKIKLPFTWKNLILAIILVIIAYLALISWKIAVIITLAVIQHIVIPAITDFVNWIGRKIWSVI